MDLLDNLQKGCCGETTVNFSLLTMPSQWYVDLKDTSLWCTAFVTFGEPYFKSVIGVQEKRHGIISRCMGRNLGFSAYVMLSYLYSLWTFVFIHHTISVQSELSEHHRNEAIIVGYMLLIVGLLVKIHIYLTTSVTTIMGGQYFRLNSAAGKMAPVMAGGDPYYHPLGTSSVICYLGFSVVQESIAGGFLALILALAYYTASHFERYLLQRGAQQSHQLPQQKTGSVYLKDKKC